MSDCFLKPVQRSGVFQVLYINVYIDADFSNGPHSVLNKQAADRKDLPVEHTNVIAFRNAIMAKASESQEKFVPIVYDTKPGGGIGLKRRIRLGGFEEGLSPL